MTKPLSSSKKSRKMRGGEWPPRSSLPPTSSLLQRVDASRFNANAFAMPAKKQPQYDIKAWRAKAHDQLVARMNKLNEQKHPLVQLIDNFYSAWDKKLRSDRRKTANAPNAPNANSPSNTRMYHTEWTDAGKLKPRASTLTPYENLCQYVEQHMKPVIMDPKDRTDPSPEYGWVLEQGAFKDDGSYPYTTTERLKALGHFESMFKKLEPGAPIIHNITVNNTHTPVAPYKKASGGSRKSKSGSISKDSKSGRSRSKSKSKR